MGSAQPSSITPGHWDCSAQGDSWFWKLRVGCTQNCCHFFSYLCDEFQIRMASKVIKKTLEEAKGVENAEIDFSDKAIERLEPDMTKMWGMKNITRLTLSHNKITELPPAVASMENLEILNLFNNLLEEVPQSLCGMPRLRILNLGVNKLSKLPRGFGSLPSIEILDLSYNNLNEDSLPSNFFIMATCR